MWHQETFKQYIFLSPSFNIFHNRPRTLNFCMLLIYVQDAWSMWIPSSLTEACGMRLMLSTTMLFSNVVSLNKTILIQYFSERWKDYDWLVTILSCVLSFLKIGYIRKFEVLNTSVNWPRDGMVKYIRTNFD